MIRCGSGAVAPDDLGVVKVSNNVTELLAVLRGLDGLPDRWRGTVCSDSRVTLARLRGGFKAGSNVPDWMKSRWFRLRRRLGSLTFRHVMGHPTAKELAAGIGSEWNCWCDEECGRRAYLTREQETSSGIRNFLARPRADR